MKDVVMRYAGINFLSLCFSPMVFALTLDSSSLANQSSIPADYTCTGKNISPAFEWKNIPDKTRSFVFILSDPDAPSGTFYHWVIYNLPKTTTQLSEGISTFPAGTQVGKNSWNVTQYKGPCPPPGSTHNYIFSLYALNIRLNLPAGADANTVSNAMQNHILDTAKAMYTFGR